MPGRLKANVRLTEAQQLELVYTYQQTVKQAFREVSDALVGYQKTRELRRQLTAARCRHRKTPRVFPTFATGVASRATSKC